MTPGTPPDSEPDAGDLTSTTGGPSRTTAPTGWPTAPDEEQDTGPDPERVRGGAADGDEGHADVADVNEDAVDVNEDTPDVNEHAVDVNEDTPETNDHAVDVNEDAVDVDDQSQEHASFWSGLEIGSTGREQTRSTVTVGAAGAVAVLVLLVVLIVGIARGGRSDWPTAPSGYIPEEVTGRRVRVEGQELLSFVNEYRDVAGFPATAEIEGGLVGDRSAILPDLVMLVAHSPEGGGDVEEARRRIAAQVGDEATETATIEGVEAVIVKLDNSTAPPGFDLWAGIAFPRPDVAVVVISFTGHEDVEAALTAVLTTGRSGTG